MAMLVIVISVYTYLCSVDTRPLTTRSCSMKVQSGAFYKANNLLGENLAYGDVQSIEDCAGYCVAEKPVCHGATFLSRQNACILHGAKGTTQGIAGSNSNKIEKRQDSVHVSISCTDCETGKFLACTYKKYSYNGNHCLIDVIPLSDGWQESLENCMKECVKIQHTCHAVTYNKDAQWCTLHYSKKFNESDHCNGNGISIHSEITCGETKSFHACKFTEFKNIRYQNNILNPNGEFQTTFQACVEKCLWQQPTCKGVSYYKMQKLCFFHWTSMTLLDENSYQHDQLLDYATVYCSLPPSSSHDQNPQLVASPQQPILQSPSVTELPAYGIGMPSSKSPPPLNSVDTPPPSGDDSAPATPGSELPPTYQPMLSSSTKGCGMQSDWCTPFFPNSRQRVMRGFTATPHSWPWQIYILRHKSFDCGGSILRVRDDIEVSDVILTAAHCLKYKRNKDLLTYDANAIEVAAGVHTLYQFNSGQQLQGARYLYPHDSYPKNTEINDIGLIFLLSPLIFSDTVRPICLPKQGAKIPKKKFCVATGWGKNNKSDANSLASTLQQTILGVHSTLKCFLKDALFIPPKELICAGDGKTDTCEGDSGGPLQCQEEDGMWAEYGVTSHGPRFPCVNKHGLPGKYARVSHYVDWINKAIKQYSNVWRFGNNVP